MQRPEIRPDNVDEYFPIYAKHDHCKLVLHAAFLASRILFHPHEVIEDGALQTYADYKDRGYNIVHFSSHFKKRDQFEIASLMHRHPETRKSYKNTQILSKLSYFNIPIIGSVIDTLGAIPTPRLKDYNDDVFEATKIMNKQIEQVLVPKLQNGKDIILFAGATRANSEIDNDDLAVRSMLGQLCLKATEQGVLIALQPYYLSYDETGKAQIYMAKAFDGNTNDRRSISKLAVTALDDAKTKVLGKPLTS